MLIIGLNGRLRSGKDTAYEYLDSVYGRSMTLRREGFADRMKLSGVRALGFDPDTVAEGVAIANQIKERGQIIVQLRIDTEIDTLVHTYAGVSGREFWQLYGTEAHRDVFGENFWVDALLPVREFGLPARLVLSRDMPGVGVLVVTDVRFPNEARRIIDLGGEVWRIDADKRLGPLPADAHPSERGLPDDLVTRVVPNNDTLGAFQDALVEAFEAVAS